ncbi:hypothetical protein CR513_33793, partial [Mucuna pruriens]
MTGNKEWFSKMEEGFCKTIKLGNDTTMVVVAKGSIRVQINGITQVISDVYFVLELKNNLLSLGQLQQKGLAILIQNGTCKVFHSDKGLIMHTSMRGNRMFYLTTFAAPKDPMCLQVEVVSEKETQLWHFHFGHLNYKGLNTLACKKMVIRLPSLRSPKKICTTYLIGKQQRESIPKKGSLRASKKLQVIHADISGPITPSSNSNKSFIDDFSRKNWIYFLHEKSKAFDMFKKFKACVEKEVGAFITCLRTDRGGEFTSKEFEDFCKDQGISRQLTAAYTPQQN